MRFIISGFTLLAFLSIAVSAKPPSALAKSETTEEAGSLLSLNRTCLVSPRTSEPPRSQAQSGLLLGSFNDILGSAQNLSYSDTAVVDSIRRMRVGGLRHPGGTVANYWSFKKAEYLIDPKTNQYYFEGFQTNSVERWPSQTFSPANFSTLGTETFFVGDSPYLHVVFDLNLLTYSTEEEMVEQVDILANTIPNASSRVRFIELGNEYYITKNYGSEGIPNSTVYMERARPVIQRVRQLLPNAKIAAVAAYGNSGWNNPIAECCKDLIDAVTIHDYGTRCDYSSPKHDDIMKQLSHVVFHGPSHLPILAEEVRSVFGKEKTIWMTEFNIGSHSLLMNNGETTARSRSGAVEDGAQCPELTWGVVHGLFALNMVISGTCLTNSTMEVMMMHMLWNQPEGWGLNQTPLQLPLSSNDPEGLQFNIVAVFYSRLNYYAVDRFQASYCVDLNSSRDTGNSDEKVMRGSSTHRERKETKKSVEDLYCPTEKVDGDRVLQCVNVIMFGSPAAVSSSRNQDEGSLLAAAVVINACPYPLDAAHIVLEFGDLLMSSGDSNNSDNFSASADIYQANVTSDGGEEQGRFTPVTRCANPNETELWKCPLNGDVQVVYDYNLPPAFGGSSSGAFVLERMPPLSIAFVEVRV